MAVVRHWLSSWLERTNSLSGSMLLAILVVAVVLLSPLLGFRFERDQSHFAWVASLWLQGELPYVDMFSHQWPGQFLIYLLIFKVVGVTEQAVMAVDLAIHAFAAVSLAAIVSCISRSVFGLVAAMLYAIYYVQMGPWMVANRETYQVALLLPGMWWLIAASPRKRVLDDVVALLYGVALGLVFLIKSTAGLALVAIAWIA